MSLGYLSWEGVGNDDAESGELPVLSSPLALVVGQILTAIVLGPASDG